MKVLLRIRSDVARFPGGDYVDALKTKHALGDLGIECIIAPGLDLIPAGIDVVHLFNLTRIHETYLQYRQARNLGLPIVLTPIWHSMREMRRFYSWRYKSPVFPIWYYHAVKELYYAKRSHLPMFLPATLRYRELQREVVMGANAVLPNSQVELDILCSELDIKPPATFIVPPVFERTVSPERNCDTRQDLLCAGRVEPRKNQVAVMRAFKALGRTEHKLLIYGSLNSSHPGYIRKFQHELVPGWVEYCGQVASDELYRAYARAKAAILASYFETCGFAVMEAMSCGANACVADSSYTRAFYSDHAVYCDPYSLGSISRGIQEVLAKPVTSYYGLLSNFTPKISAEMTRLAYQHSTEGTACLLTKT